MPSGEGTNLTSEDSAGAAVVAVAASSVDAALPESEKELARLPPEAEEEQEPADAAGNESDVVETLDDAQRLFDEGRDALRSEDYEEATELLSRALEIRARHYGELAIECAFTYYKYGCALLYKAQSESDPLGEVVTEATEPSSNEARETGGETNGEQQEEEDLEEEESDLDMAWKMLDIARVIYEKQQSHSIEEVDTITALADISLEREDFDMCFRDYTKALEIMEGLVEPDDRGIAELCFKLCLAQQLGYKPKEALKYCQQAVSVCEARLKRLRNEVAVARGTADPKGKSAMYSDTHKESLPLAREDQPSLQLNASVATENTSCKKQEDEIKEIEQLLEDLRDKVVELEGMASGPSLLDSLKETNPGALNSIKQVFSVTAQLASQETNGGNTSHAEPSNGGFDATSMSASAAPVTHLGVVGRGVKRATPVCITSLANGQESTTKRRSLDDMMTRGGVGDTYIGFGTNTASDGSSSK